MERACVEIHRFSISLFVFVLFLDVTFYRRPQSAPDVIDNELSIDGSAGAQPRRSEKASEPLNVSAL